MSTTIPGRLDETPEQPDSAGVARGMKSVLRTGGPCSVGGRSVGPCADADFPLVPVSLS